MSRDEDFLPDEDIVTNVLTHSVCRIHRTVERTMKLHLPTSIQLFVRDESHTPLQLACPAPTHKRSSSWPVVTGQGRLRFRHAFHGWRKLYFYQAIYPEPPTSDFSGIQFSGEVRLAERGFLKEGSRRITQVALQDGNAMQIIHDVYCITRIERQWHEWI